MLNTEVTVHNPRVERSLGRDEEATIRKSSPAVMSGGAPLVRTGEILEGESHSLCEVRYESERSLTFEVFAGLPAGSSSSFVATLAQLPDPKYELLRPIPVCVDQIEGQEFVACFEKAGLAMSADTLKLALAHLGDHLLDALESFSENESKLGPLPAAQLTALRQFIREKTRG